jgi:hypothetical protein
MVVKNLLKQHQNPKCWNLPQLYQVDRLHSCWQWKFKKFSIIIQRFYYTTTIEIIHVVMSFFGGFSTNKIGSSILADA